MAESQTDAGKIAHCAPNNLSKLARELIIA